MFSEEDRFDIHLIVEIGGENKSYDQIADIPKYILADDIERPHGSRSTLWLVDFLYSKSPGVGGTRNQ